MTLDLSCDPPQISPRRIFLLGASGSIGRAVAAALLARGFKVVCFVRSQAALAGLPKGVEVRYGDVTNASSMNVDGLRGEQFEAVISCIASRTGSPDDAWAVDFRANRNALEAASGLGINRFIFLSAICVQRPRLAFQHAKLAFEEALVGSGLTYTIVRPTAFFKSLSGQVARVSAGKAFLLFGDGALTACKPISNDDLAAFIVNCLDDASTHDRILPIGGPGPAITPRDQAEALFALTGRPPKYVHTPVRLLDAIVFALSLAARLYPPLTAKAEFARIGRYYATESMLVLNPLTGKYDADATPSTGSQTLTDHYKRMLQEGEKSDLGAHAVF